MKTAFLFDMKMPGARRAADWLKKTVIRWTAQ